MNDTIASYLDQYLKMPQTDFAVFLNGAWGSGKTFFLNQYLADRYGKSKDCAKDKKFWRVSLNGLSTEESVGLHLLGNLLPHGNSLPAIIGARLSNWLLKRFFDFDLKTMFNGNEVSRYLSGKGVKPELIIFDDFERSVLSPERVLAFISSLVENGSKVVIIGAEKEIRGDVEQNTPYCRIREKVVGKTFDIECDLERVFQDLVGKDVFPNAEKPLLAAQGVLITLIKKYDTGVRQSNLRALKHAFRDFDYFKLRRRGLSPRQFARQFLWQNSAAPLPSHLYKSGGSARRVKDLPRPQRQGRRGGAVRLSSSHPFPEEWVLE